MAEPMILYGVPFSQPVRAVMWLLINKRAPFEMELINPGSKGDNGSRSESYLAMNPGGTIPTMLEPDTGFVLSEAHAILCYLCRKHGWNDLYPVDLQKTAQVDWYLHYHHRNVRDASTGLVAPRIRKDLNIPEAMQHSAHSTLTRALQTLNEGWLASRPYITGDDVTIADIAAYVEIGQLRPEFTNVYDFSPFPNVQRWLDAMMEVPGHDEVHTVMREMGDISNEPPSMDKIKNANKEALRALKAYQATL